MYSTCYSIYRLEQNKDTSSITYNELKWKHLHVAKLIKNKHKYNHTYHRYKNAIHNFLSGEINKPMRNLCANIQVQLNKKLIRQ